MRVDLAQHMRNIEAHELFLAGLETLNSGSRREYRKCEKDAVVRLKALTEKVERLSGEPRTSNI